MALPVAWIKSYRNRSFIGLFTSFVVVAWGQPALIGWLGALSAACGVAIFLLALDGFPQKRRVLVAGLWFMSVQLVQLSWMTSIEFQGYYILFIYVVLALILGGQFAFFVWTIPSAPLSWGRMLACAALWTCLEWLRLFVFCGFSWNPIGLSLCYFSYSLQWASIWGLLGLSFWVVLTNLAVFNYLARTTPCKNRVVLSCFTTCLLILTPYVFGYIHVRYHRLQAKKNEKYLDIALIQTALLPSEKNPYTVQMHRFIPPFEQWRQLVRALLPLKNQRLDLVLFPEAVLPLQADLPLYSFDQVCTYFRSTCDSSIDSCFPPPIPPYAGLYLLNGQQEVRVSHLFWAQTLCNYLNLEMVMGLDYTDKNINKNFNSAFYLRPKQEGWQRYDKRILLPLGEYLPFSFLRRWTKYYGIVDFFSPGSTSALWKGCVPFSPCICYEETFSDLIRESKQQGAELLVNLTNDNYYPDSTLHKQHFFHARLRSVENGLPLIRSCNAGVSGAIDSLGQIIGWTDELSENSPLVLRCQLNSYSYTPLFSRYGERGVIGLLLFFLCCYAGFLWKRNHLKRDF